MPKTHPTYDSGFRQEAVNLLLSSQRPLKTVAAELGVSANSLRHSAERPDMVWSTARIACAPRQKL